MSNSQYKNWTFAHTAICILFVFIFPCLIYFHEPRLVEFLRLYLVKGWLLVITGFLIVILAVGHGVTGSWKGAFIDNRNIMSLSRFQILWWTIIILSGFTVITFWNVFIDGHICLADKDKGCLPSMPEELWLLMGISTASMVGSPLILENKRQQTENESEKTQMFELLKQQGYDENLLDTRGQLVVNKQPSEARFVDLFTGEEIGNFAHLDLARLQMFFFTVVAIVMYSVQLGKFLSEAMVKETLTRIDELPTLSSGMLALIGISHTGYLAAKGISNSQTGNATKTEPSSLNSTNEQAVG